MRTRFGGPMQLVMAAAMRPGRRGRSLGGGGLCGRSLLAGVVGLVAIGNAAALGQAPAAEVAPAEPAAAAAGNHLVTAVVIRFAQPGADLPPEATLLGATIRVTELDGVLVPVGGGVEGMEGGRELSLAEIGAIAGGVRLSDMALAEVAPAIVGRLKSLNLRGVYATPDVTQFRVEDGRVVDARVAGDTTLVVDVTVARVAAVTTVGLGERLPEDQTNNHPLHARLLARSPVVAEVNEGEIAEGKTSLLRTDLIDDFVFRLNRHPGRRVDPRVSAPGEAPGQVQLDYLITENRPWLLFGQVSNTGSGSTSSWREHLGFIHNDLTNHDDILQVGYHTANFEDVHLLYGSYERPLAERLRAKVLGSWYTYLASDVGQPDADFEGDGYDFGAELAWNFYQRRELFVDLVAGVKFQHIAVDNQLAAVEGDSDFLMPNVGLRLERHREDSHTHAYAGLRFNMPDVIGTEEDLDPLGRTNADDSFAVLQGEVTHSFYLEPLLSGPGEVKGLAHEILIAARGQTALDSRLIPNEQMTAGGLYTVRGYPESIVAGDNVIMGTLEYRLHVPRAMEPELDPGTLGGQPFRWRPQYEAGPTDWDLILKVFVDAARLTQTDAESFETDSTLIGAGIGAELAITRRFNVRADLGFALTDVDDAFGDSVVDSGNAELHVVLTLIY